MKEREHVLIHIRLKIGDYRFLHHSAQPAVRLIFIDWLTTRHVRARARPAHRLFPGQDVPGLGILRQITAAITRIAVAAGAEGAFNIPEYFHDAVLFHRQFRFYDPVQEATLHAVIRDLHRFGARSISQAYVDGRVANAEGKCVAWHPSEMILLANPRLRGEIFSRAYLELARRTASGLSFRLTPATCEGTPGDVR
nr:hypothetical protein [uncultured bacterium]